jgi:hypothetical protein
MGPAGWSIPTAGQGGQNENLVRDNIQHSFDAFQDEDHDGQDDGEPRLTQPDWWLAAVRLSDSFRTTIGDLAGDLVPSSLSGAGTGHRPAAAGVGRVVLAGGVENDALDLLATESPADPFFVIGASGIIESRSQPCSEGPGIISHCRTIWVCCGARWNGNEPNREDDGPPRASRRTNGNRQDSGPSWGAVPHSGRSSSRPGGWRSIETLRC